MPIRCNMSKFFRILFLEFFWCFHPEQGFPGGSEGKVSASSVGDLGSIPGSGRFSGEGKGNPLLPGKSHGLRSLVGYSPWGCKESDTTERLPFHPEQDSSPNESVA